MIFTPNEKKTGAPTLVGKVRPMVTVVRGGGLEQHDGHEGAGSGSLIDSLAREGARRMLAAALQAEVEAYIILAAQRRWRAVTAPHLVALVRAGATFTAGVLVERPDTSAPAREPRVEDGHNDSLDEAAQTIFIHRS